MHLTPSFVHLDVHTDFSLTDSLISVNELVSAAVDCGMVAVAITDKANLFATIRFYTKCLAVGIKPIIGTEITISAGEITGPLKLYCKTTAGYKNLLKLISDAHQLFKRGREEPLVPLEYLLRNSGGLLALSGGNGSVFNQLLLTDFERAKDFSRSLLNAFDGDFFVEIQRVTPSDEDSIEPSIRLCIETKAPIVATNRVRFLNRSDFLTHEVRLCVSKKITLSQRSSTEIDVTAEQHFKSVEDMCRLFSDIPSALENTVVIAKKCSAVIELGKSYLPTFKTPSGIGEGEYLIQKCEEGLRMRLKMLYASNTQQIEMVQPAFEDRMRYELDVIIKMGFSGYFLIVADFIDWAKRNAIPVGPGRGSGAGSLVAYVLGITDLEPMRYGLLFERFLNPERVSMPDFDVDFCQDKRDLVIDYVGRRYGKDAVSQIITYGTAAAKGVIKDVARVFGHPYLFGDRISKMIPDEPGTTIAAALEGSPEFKLLYETDPDFREVAHHAMKMEGLTRQVGKHAGGVLISPSKLTDFTPIYCDSEGGNVVSQYDKDDVEAVGLVKFDFLGLRNLTVINDAVSFINARHQGSFNILDIPLDDEGTFSLLKRNETTAVFQLESRGMKDLLNRLKPDNFEDIISLVALFRPGPLQSGMVDTFVNRKHGREGVDFPHPLLEPVLINTYGVILYQEQVMQIAQVLSGYTLGQADLLRRAMGKKKPEEMAKQRQIFIQGAINNGIAQSIAEAIFNDMEKFAAYGFNKSHSAAYALISYQTAWLKCHYPAEFMAAALSSEMNNTDKIVKLIDESRRMGLTILEPCINQSDRMFTVKSDSEIVYGLEAIKGIGPSVVDLILNERRTGGRYRDLFDFCGRCNISKSAIEAAIHSGMLDSLGLTRSTMMASYRDATAVGKQIRKTQASQQNDLFGNEDYNYFPDSYILTPEYDDEAIYAGELKTLGLYLTKHPIDKYAKELGESNISSLCRALSGELPHGSTTYVAGLLVEINASSTKSWQACSLKLDDKTAQIDIRIRQKIYASSGHFLTIGQIIIARVIVMHDLRKEKISLQVESLSSLQEFRNSRVDALILNIPGITPGDLQTNHEFVRSIHLNKGPARLLVNLKSGWHELESKIEASETIIAALKKCYPDAALEVVYKDRADTFKRAPILSLPHQKDADGESRKRISELLSEAREAVRR